MTFATLQNQAQKQPETPAADLNQSFSLSQGAITSPYAGLSKVTGFGGAIDLNVPMTPSANVASVGPLTIQPAPAPSAEVVIMPRGTALRFSPDDISAVLGRPDDGKITVRGKDNILLFPDATPVTEVGDGTFQTQGSVRAILPEAAIRFPGENGVIRFDGFPVLLKEGSVLQHAPLAQAA